MATEAEIFEIQIGSLKEAVDVLEKRVKEIDQIERETKYGSESEAEMKAAIGTFRVRSLKLYKDTLSYIATEVGREEPKVHFFLLPHTRTLLDVYARFIHLLENCKDQDQQALVCIAYQLLLSKYLDSESEYLKTLALYQNFLKQTGFDFPTNLSGYSRTWIEKQGLAFGNMRDLLTSDNIKKYSFDTKKIFDTDGTYRIYSGFSEYLHGNPYYYNESSHNEKFWVIAICLSMTAFLIELIDLYILEKRGAKDFRVWLNEIKKNKLDFINLWRNKKISPSLNFV